LRVSAHHQDTDKPCGFGVLIFALVFPTILTWVYFSLLDGGDSAIQQVAYTVGKVVQFGLPLFWVLWVLRRRVRIGYQGAGVLPGALFGVLAGGGIYLLYRWWLLPGDSLVGPIEVMRAKVVGIGIDTQMKFALLGLGYSAVHSLLEEYYWRWFVFAQLRHRTSLLTAVLVSSLGFMAHHVIVLATYFGWDSPISYLASIGVAVGGAVWALLYERTGSLYGGWLSHCLVDAAIFLVGFEMLRPYLA
jgi:membrane protease YdiL (CAAX protease family)